MKLNPCNPKPWKISKEAERNFSVTQIESAFTFFNRAININGCVYLVDYKRSKFFFGEASCPTVCGYSRDIVKKENFNIFNIILSKDGLNWFEKMHENAMEIFYQQENMEIRMQLEFSYNLVVKDVNGKKIILHQKLVPCELDENGNLWRALCYAWSSPFLSTEYNAKIENYKTGDRFDYIDGEFKLSKRKSLTQDEILILRYLAKGVPMKQIATNMNIPKTTVEQKERSAFKKLGANTQASATCMAMSLGYIRF